MDRDKLLNMMEATGVWLQSPSAYAQLKAEYAQCHIRLCLVSADIEDPCRAYTKKEMAYLRKKQTALVHYEGVLEKQMNACYPDVSLVYIMKELEVMCKC